MPSIVFCKSDYYYDEDDYKFITISVGSGGFFANRHPANYYNGKLHNVNNIEYATLNTQWMDAVTERLNGRGWWINPNTDLPSKMRYKLTAPISVRAAMNLSPFTSVFLQVNQMTLVATDIFVVNVLDPPNFEPRRIQCPIWGKESRTMLDVGFQWSEDIEAHNWQVFYEVAFNLTNTKVIENYIEIEGLRQSIMERGTYNPGQGFSSPALPETAWGIGLVGSFGWRYVINPSASLDFGATAYLQDINLTGYNKFHLNFNVFARFNLLMF
jgi:hypothetical protein